MFELVYKGFGIREIAEVNIRGQWLVNPFNGKIVVRLLVFTIFKGSGRPG